MHFEAAPERRQDQKKALGDPLLAAVARSNAASFSLWEAVAARGNFVVSPYSIRSAFSLVYLAAAPGQGRNKLRLGMRFPARNEELGIQRMGRAVQVYKEARFESANAVWFARELALRASYSDLLSRTVSAEAHPVDISADPAKARRTINAWVSERTRGKIPGILPSLSRQERVVLVNAVYFFAKWSDPFEPAATTRKGFWREDGPAILAETMAGSSCQAVFCGDHRAAMVGYRDTSMVLVLVVPTSWRDFRWDASAFDTVWTELGHGRYADLELPKFTLRSRRDLSRLLEGLGIRPNDPTLLARLFLSDVPVFVTTAIHEAVFEVEETSTEAAAATAISGLEPISSTKKVPPPVFRADRPFYFLLVERNTGLITFMGQVTDPAAAGG